METVLFSFYLKNICDSVHLNFINLPVHTHKHVNNYNIKYNIQSAFGGGNDVVFLSCSPYRSTANSIRKKKRVCRSLRVYTRIYDEAGLGTLGAV